MLREQHLEYPFRLAEVGTKSGLSIAVFFELFFGKLLRTIFAWNNVRTGRQFCTKLIAENKQCRNEWFLSVKSILFLSLNQIRHEGNTLTTAIVFFYIANTTQKVIFLYVFLLLSVLLFRKIYITYSIVYIVVL